MTPLVELRRRLHPTCSSLAPSLGAYVAGETDLDPRAAAHLASCLRCQAEVAKYRRMLRTLKTLRSEGPPTGEAWDSDAWWPHAPSGLGALSVTLVAVGAALGGGAAGVALGWRLRGGRA